LAVVRVKYSERAGRILSFIAITDPWPLMTRRYLAAAGHPRMSGIRTARPQISPTTPPNVRLVTHNPVSFRKKRLFFAFSPSLSLRKGKFIS
jgi:hypothetical protein